MITTTVRTQTHDETPLQPHSRVSPKPHALPPPGSVVLAPECSTWEGHSRPLQIWIASPSEAALRSSLLCGSALSAEKGKHSVGVLSFPWGKMRTMAWEPAFQMTLRSYSGSWGKVSRCDSGEKKCVQSSTRFRTRSPLHRSSCHAHSFSAFLDIGRARD